LKRPGRSLDFAWRVVDQMMDVTLFGTRGNARMSFGRVDREVGFCGRAPELAASFRGQAIRDRDVIEAADGELGHVHEPDAEV
jgi:hypothetical protein